MLLERNHTGRAILVTISAKSQGFSEETVLVTPRLSRLAVELALAPVSQKLFQH